MSLTLERRTHLAAGAAYRWHRERIRTYEDLMVERQDGTPESIREASAEYHTAICYWVLVTIHVETLVKQLDAGIGATP